MSSPPRPEDFLAHGSAVALVGRITGIAPPGSSTPAPRVIDLNVVGGSAALATTAGLSRSEADDGKTMDGSRVISAFKRVEAKIEHTLVTGGVGQVGGPPPLQRVTRGEVSIEGFFVGLATRFRVGRGTLAARSEYRRRPGSDFFIENAQLSEVVFERDRPAGGFDSYRLRVHFASTNPNPPVPGDCRDLCGRVSAIRSYRELVRSRRLPHIAERFLPNIPLRPSSFFFCPPRHASRHIVIDLRWEDNPFPGSTLGPNHAHIPDFGTVHFGEVYDKSDTEVVTLYRFDLGCSLEGGGSGGYLYMNSSEWPP